MSLERPVKRRKILKTGFKSNRRDGHIALPEQLSRLCNTNIVDILNETLVNQFATKIAELPYGHVRHPRSSR